MTIQENIHNLVQKYEQNKEFYRTSRFNETMLRNEFLDPFFEILGWDIKNASGKCTSEREVLLEEALKVNATSHAKKPVYTFRLYGERKFFVEAKKPCVHIENDDLWGNKTILAHVGVVQVFAETLQKHRILTVRL